MGSSHQVRHPGPKVQFHLHCDVLDRIVAGDCPVHYIMLSSIPGLYLVEASDLLH